MEDLDNTEEDEFDERSFEAMSNVPGTSQRSQPIQNCKVDLNSNQDTSSDSELYEYPEDDSSSEFSFIKGEDNKWNQEDDTLPKYSI